MAFVHSYLQDIELPKVIELLEQSLAIHTAEGDKLNQAMTMTNMVGILIQKNINLGLARQYAEASKHLLASLGNRRYISHNLLSLGILEKNQGRIPEAESYYQEALSICQEIGDRLGEAHLLSALGNLYRAQGQLDKAISILEKSLSLNRDLGNAHMVVNVLGFLSNTYLRHGSIDKCGQALNELCEIAYKGKEKYAVFNVHRRLAEFMRLTQRDCTEAEKHLALAETNFSPAFDYISQYNYYLERIKLQLCRGIWDHDSIARQNELFQQYGLDTRPEFRKEKDKIMKAIEYTRERKTHLLYRGELWEDIHEGLKNWIIANMKP